MDMGRARAYAARVDLNPLVHLRDSLERTLKVGGRVFITKQAHAFVKQWLLQC